MLPVSFKARLRRERVVVLFLAGTDPPAIAAELDVRPETINNDLTTLRARGLVPRRGTPEYFALMGLRETGFTERRCSCGDLFETRDVRETECPRHRRGQMVRLAAAAA